jgi:hypothetical protein
MNAMNPSETIEQELAKVTDDIRRKANRLTTLGLVLWTAIVLGCYLVTRDLDATAKLSSVASFFVLFGWGGGFVYAYFLRMEKKSDIGLRLALQTSRNMEAGKDIAMPIVKNVEKVVSDINGMSDDVKRVVTDVVDVVAKVRASIDKYEKMAGGDTLRGAAEELKAVIGNNGVIGRVEQHLSAIAEAARTLKPMPVVSPAGFAGRKQ